MSRNLKEEVVKLAYLYKSIDSLMLIKDSNLSDSVKRNYMRFFFITIDNVLKNVRFIKNQVKSKGLLDKTEIRILTEQIDTLSNSFEGSYDVIRDKISAHQQEMELDKVLIWWGEITETTLTVLFHDLDNIRASLSKAFKEFEDRIVNQSLLFNDIEMTVGTGIPKFGTSRTSLANGNSVAMIASKGRQTKEALISSAIEFMKEDFFLTIEFDNSGTNQAGAVLFDIGWLLAIVDFVSFLDCLYKDHSDDSGNITDKSLATYWKDESIAGLNTLLAIPRNSQLEAEILKVRNTMSAHLDSKQTLIDTYSSYASLNLQEINLYINRFVNAYFSACREDIRTKLNPMNGISLDKVDKNVLPNPQPSLYPFDK